jgi:hypothetical protein
MALAACGGNSGQSETDHAPPFTGNWYGQAHYTLTSGGQTVTDSNDVLQTVVRNGTNQLRLPTFCSEADPGPEADVVSPTEFRFRAYSCTIPTQSCQETLSLTGGSGTLSNQTLAFTVQGTVTVAGGAGCPSGTAQVAIAFSGTHDLHPTVPKDLVATPGDFYGRFLLSWTLTGTALYDVQARIGSGSYQVVTAQEETTGVSVDLEPSTLPERTSVTFRIRLVNPWAVSDFSNEAETRSLLLPPEPRQVPNQSRTLPNGLQISWVGRPDVTALVVERAPVQSATPTGPYTPVGSADGGQGTFVDTTVVEGGYYDYRARWVDGAMVGYPSSGPRAQAGVFPPSDLIAVGGVGQVQLSWVNHSQAATEIAIEGGAGLNPNTDGPDVARLPAAATSYTLHVPTGVYTYWLEARGFPSSDSDPVFVATTVSSSQGTWSTAFLDEPFADEPFATRAVPDPAGRFLFWNSRGLLRSDGATALVRSPSTSLPIPLPYFAVDDSENPHLVYAQQTTNPGGSTIAVLHDWFDGTAWQSEELTRTALQAYWFTLDSSGHPVVALSTDGTISGLRVIRWSQSAYVVENPSPSFNQPSNAVPNVLVAAGSGGRIHLVAETTSGETVHAWYDGSWSSEPMTLSSASAQIVRLAVFGNDQLALLFADFGAAQVLERGSSGWAAPVQIVSDGPIFYATDAALDAARDGTPPALLIRTHEGLQLALQSEGWAPQVLMADSPIIGFGHDANDKLYAIVEEGQDFSASPPVTHAVVLRQP